jgi:hypothetical protein
METGPSTTLERWFSTATSYPPPPARPESHMRIFHMGPFRQAQADQHPCNGYNKPRIVEIRDTTIFLIYFSSEIIGGIKIVYGQGFD